MTMPIRWVALTGTPGVGKSSVARSLRRLGFTVVDGNEFAIRHGCVVGYDRRRQSRIVEPAYVGRELLRAFPADDEVRAIEGHWSHDVPGVDAAIVLRLNPRNLERRLRARRWSKAKVRENLEAEVLHVILYESLTRLGDGRVGEIDLTRRSPASAARAIARVLRAPEKRLTNLEIGRVDWTRELLRWY